MFIHGLCTCAHVNKMYIHPTKPQSIPHLSYLVHFGVSVSRYVCGLARKALEQNRKRRLELVELLVLTALVGFFAVSLGGFVARILHRRISSGFGVSYRTHAPVHNLLTC